MIELRFYQSPRFAMNRPTLFAIALLIIARLYNPVETFKSLLVISDQQQLTDTTRINT